MAVSKTEGGTLVPEDSFALVIGAGGQLETVVPTMDADAPLTNGHILIIGLARKLQDADWSNALIAETGELLKKAHELAVSMEPSEKV